VYFQLVDLYSTMYVINVAAMMFK